MTTALLRQPGRPRDWTGATSPPRWRQPAAGGSAPDPLAGDANAFVDWFYARHAAGLRAYAARILFDIHEAEDVVQETAFRAWRNFATLSSERGSIGRWLFRVARNVAIDRIRSRQARPPEVDDLDPDADVWTVPDFSEATVNSLDIAHALATLTPAQRAVLREVFFLGRTCAAAATALDIPTGTVKSRLYYALRKLRDVLDEQRSQPDSAL
ncbi:MAG: polymerase sigma-70 factor, subfamily [Mycobacteriales bacterium]|jgi:RNA polymerase sigma-70 factor (ECF subfamily)